MSNIDQTIKPVGRLFALPWYPILFSLYPAPALLAINLGEVKPDVVLRPIIASGALAGLLLLFFRLLHRNLYKAAHVTFLWLVVFFSYGHVYNLVSEHNSPIDLTNWLPFIAVTILMVTLWWTGLPKLTFKPQTISLNLVSISLLLYSLLEIAGAYNPGSGNQLGAQNAPIQAGLSLPVKPPNIYLFILDSYTRADLMQEAYGYDNSDFIRELQERGFYVADCSMANYVRTEISLASSLNMMYLQDLDPAFNPDSTRRRILWDSLKHSAVRYNLENLGYRTVSFATGYAWSELNDADQFLSPPTATSSMNEFETLFVSTTLARHMSDLGWLDPDAILGQNYRDRFNLIFDSMDELARMPGPVFAHIHVISPHPPFVFDANGNPTYPPDFWNEKKLYPPDLYARGYQDQATYLNKKLLEAIDTLLSVSETAPIIILQGDHGPWLQPKDKRLWILNAYHLPGHNEELYPTITPVNTFRLVFDAYFGGNYDMLVDASYYSPVPKLYEFTEIPNRCDR